MAVDIFLELKDVKGEAKDAEHAGEIDILSFSWGMTQSGSTHQGSGSGAGKVNVQDLTVTKYLDRSSPTLIQFCCNGKHIKTGKLTARKAGGDEALEYMTIKLEDIIVTAVQSGGSGGEDRFTENVTLNFGKFDYEYQVQAEEGSKKEGIPVSWNIARNAPA